MISIAHLEPVVKDVYSRPYADHPDSVFIQGDTNEWKSFEVERLVDKRITIRRGKRQEEYLVRWKGYGPEFDQWYHVDTLDNCKELVRDYELLNRPVRQLKPYKHRSPEPSEPDTPTLQTAPDIASLDISAPSQTTAPNPTRRSARLLSQLTAKIKGSKS